MPELDHGFVSFSDEEIALIKEHGLCIFCDFQKTCQIFNHNISITSSWKAHGDHIKIVVRECSAHEWKQTKTFGVRGQ